MKKSQKLNLISEHITLTQEEKDRLWQNIVAVNEFSHLVVDSQIDSHESLHWTKYLFGIVSSVAVIAILFVGANQSLPGEVLYALKTDVSEPIQRFQAVDIEDKLILEQKLITKRVQEAKTLKNLGKLDEGTAEKIEAQISKQAKSVIAKSDDSESDSDETETSAEITTATAVAETKGTAVGSIDAVKVLSGKPIELDESTGESKTSTKLDQEIESAKASDKKPAPKPSDKKPSDPAAEKIESDNTKEVIKEKTIKSVAEIESETLPKIKKTIPAKSSEPVISDPLPTAKQMGISATETMIMSAPIETKDLQVDTIAEVVEYTENKIKQTKESLEKESSEVDTAELLEAVEETAATSALTKGLE